MIMRNTELLQETMQYIKDHPWAHDQRVVVNPGLFPDAGLGECGSTACYFGLAAMLSGWTARQVDACDTPITSIGIDLLGLTRKESSILFCSVNTIDDLELMVKELVDGNEIQSPYASHGLI